MSRFDSSARNYEFLHSDMVELVSFAALIRQRPWFKSRYRYIQQYPAHLSLKCPRLGLLSSNLMARSAVQFCLSLLWKGGRAGLMH